MKLIFPLLTISLIICAMRYPFSTISASAQQHHSFASARYLSMEQPVSFMIAANASEYCYFISLHSQKNTENYQITISDSSSISISAYNDQGNVVPMKTSRTDGSTWTGSLNPVADSKRFFLVLQNLTKKDVSVQLSVQNHSASTSTPSQKSQNNNTGSATKRPRQTSKPKTTTTKKPSKNSQKHFIPKATVVPQRLPKRSWQSSVPKTTAAPNRSKSPQTYTPKNTATSEHLPKKSQQSSVPKATADSRCVPKKPQQSFRHNTKKPQNRQNKSFAHPSSISSPQPKNDTSQTNHVPFRSNSILSSHFVRMSAGYSVSAFELLPIHLPENEITLKTLTPDLLSLQNNIIYAKKSGLAVLCILYNGHTTTCTIYIQEIA